MSGKLNTAFEPTSYDAQKLVASGERLDSQVTSEAIGAAYGKSALASIEKGKDTSAAYLSDFQIVGLDDKATSIAVLASKPLSPNLESAVDKIEKAANGGLTGIGTDEAGLWDAIAPLNEKEFELVNERFAQKYGKTYALFGEKWDVRRELIDELGTVDLARFDRMIADKKRNDVPEEFRTGGETLLKDGSGLKVGELNRVKLADGRDYDVYVPKNADSRAPVMVAMGGAGIGDMKGVMATETGLTIEAERSGSIVVFANPKARAQEGHYGIESATWNVPGRSNMLAKNDNSYDDRDYLDNVLKDLSTKSNTSDKVGLIGFSDGARFAEVYAADRPERVAGIAAMSGTWMKGDQAPTKAVPIMIVHGEKDEILPYRGGEGTTSNKISVETNLNKSLPSLQAKVWSEAGGGDAQIIERSMEGNVERRVYNAGSNTVTEYMIKGADHGVHDYRNNGSRILQWALGQPDLKQDMVTKSSGFLKQYIVRDLKRDERN